MERLIAVAEEKINVAPEVIEIETAGFQVISELLERFIPVIDDGRSMVARPVRAAR